MKPVYQTKFGFPDGNCFAACIASIFELSIDEVPNFCAVENDWVKAASDWCRERFGFALVCLHYPTEGDYAAGAQYMADFFASSGAFVICGVRTSRGHLHAVVYQYGQLVHDPHPGGSEIVGRIEDFTILFPIDVARFIGGGPRRQALEEAAQIAENYYDLVDEAGCKRIAQAIRRRYIPANPSQCNCWQGTSAMGGDSRVREKCPVHGVLAGAESAKGGV